MTPEELDALRTKYEKMRAEHKAKIAAAAGGLAEVKELIRPTGGKKPTLVSGIKCTLPGKLTREGGQDTEGHLFDMFVESDGTLQNILKGDRLVVTDKDGKTIFDETLLGDVRGRSRWPAKNLDPTWFDREFTATLVREVQPFDPWHIERVIKHETGKFPYHLSKEERVDAIARYTETALDFVTNNGLKIDMVKAGKVLESFQEKGVA